MVIRELIARRFVILTILCLAFSLNVQARIKLAALPDREKVILNMESPASTLVEEERTLTLQKGINLVDFSWKGVYIDPDSIRIRILSHPSQVVLINVSYPPGENALVWQINCAEAVEERIRISYLLSNIDRLVSYKAVAERNESHINLRSSLILRNFSGEDFSDACIRLAPEMSLHSSIRNEETKCLLFFSKNNVPVEKIFTFDAGSLPWEPELLAENVGIPVTYLIRNDSGSGLGAIALPAGKVRIFQDDGSGGTIFLGEDRSSFTPVGGETEVYIGDSRDIVVTQHKMKEEALNIRRNRSNRIILRDIDETIRVVIENFKKQSAVLTLIEHIPGEWEMKKCRIDGADCGEFKKVDANTIEWRILVPPEAKKTLIFNYLRRNVR